MLQHQKILVGVTGGIAAYKSIELVRLLKKQGVDVRVVMTQHAQAFVTSLTFQAVSGYPVATELMDENITHGMSHIQLAQWADSIVIAPASANVIAKLAHGFADDLLSTICLASQAKVIIAPAMNRVMWEHSATQHNIQKLLLRGAQMVGPESGEQACGDVGLGCMSEPEKIVTILQNNSSHTLLKNKKIIITAGPTQETIDPIRFLSNKSSGKMGYALAVSAAQMGADVILISGPTHLENPPNVKTMRVITAQQMCDSVFEHLAGTEIFVGAAAVANYQLENPSTQKIKSNDANLFLKLIKNPDIIHAVSRSSHRPALMIGFAAETEGLIDSAKQKLKTKDLDMIIANQVGEQQGMGTDTNTVTLIDRAGRQTHFSKIAKTQLAFEIWKVILGSTLSSHTVQT